jgi:hypothetical protein
VETPRIIAAAAILEAGDATVEARGDTRVNLSVPHLISAATYAVQLRSIEAANTGKEFGEFWNDVFASATTTVFASVAALESYANELFIDHQTVFPELWPEVMAKLWELYEQKPPLEKFDFALVLKTGIALDRGANLYQDVATLIKLRNGLMHFKPEWFSEQEEHAKLSQALRYRATHSPLLPVQEPLFPRAWASYATSAWVVRSVLAFLLEFERRAHVPGRMSKHQERFNAL